MPINLSEAIKPLLPRRRLIEPEKYKIITEANQAMTMAGSIIGLEDSKLEKSMIVAINPGPAIKGTAKGKMNGSPFGRLALKLVCEGNKILIAIKKRIKPEANLTEDSDSFRKSRT